MKLCVIGNSQMACLSEAWKQGVPAPSDLQVGFFGASSDWLNTLEWTGDRLASPVRRVSAMLAMTTGGEASLDPVAWDGFVLVGLGFAPRPFNPARWPDQRLSRAVRLELQRGRLDGSTMGHVLRLLRERSDKPVWLVPNPLARPSDEAEPVPAHAQDHAGAMADLRDAVANSATQIVGQPAETLLEDRWTRPEFGEGAIGLAVNKDGDTTKGAEDRTHMNPAFGKLVWQALLAEVAR